MQENGIFSKTSKKFRVTTTDSRRSKNIADNILNRDFESDEA